MNNYKLHARARTVVSKWQPIRAALFGLTLLGSIGSVSASTLTVFSDTFSPQQAGWNFASPSAGYLGQLNDNVNVGSVSLSQTFSGPLTDVMLEFDLLGFRSLDPINCCTDTLTVRLDGVVQYVAAMGFSVINNITTPVPFTAAVAGAGPDASTRYRITLDVGALAAGPHTFDWGYGHLQSFADEAWGLDNVLIVAVPEPMTLVLLGLGLAGLGFSRRKKA